MINFIEKFFIEYNNDMPLNHIVSLNAWISRQVYYYSNANWSVFLFFFLSFSPSFRDYNGCQISEINVDKNYKDWFLFF